MFWTFSEAKINRETLTPKQTTTISKNDSWSKLNSIQVSWRPIWHKKKLHIDRYFGNTRENSCNKSILQKRPTTKFPQQLKCHRNQIFQFLWFRNISKVFWDMLLVQKTKIWRKLLKRPRFSRSVRVKTLSKNYVISIKKFYLIDLRFPVLVAQNQSNLNC